MFRCNNDETLPAKRVQIGLVRITAQANGLLGALGGGSVQSHNRGSRSNEIKRYSEISMSPFVLFHRISKGNTLVGIINHHRFLNLKVQQRFRRPESIANQFEIALPQNDTSLLPVFNRGNACKQIVPG